MRKFIKNARQQSQGNSYIAKEVKRRFHYEPSQKSQKVFLIAKPKDRSHPLKQLKDDFSSVKDNKQDNNQINESSWISKLVNVMHENSLQQLKPTRYLQQKNIEINIQFTEPQPQCSYNKKEIIVHYQNKETPNKCVNMVKPLALKKNNNKNIDKRYQNGQNNGKKNKIKYQNEQSSQIISTTTTRKNTIKKSKSNIHLKNDNFSPDISKLEKTNQKSSVKKNNLQKIISGKKLFYGNQRFKQQCNFDYNPGQSTKQIDSKRNKQYDIPYECQQKKKLSQSLTEMQEIKCNNVNYCSKQISFDQIKQKIDIILEDQIKSPLFRQKQQNSLVIQEVKPKQQKRKAFGSIKKNKITKNESNYKTDATQLKKQFKQTFTLSKGRQNEMITQREQQKLITKYCKQSINSQSYQSKISQNLPLSRDFNKKYSYLNNNINNSQNNTQTDSKMANSQCSNIIIKNKNLLQYKNNNNKIKMQNHEIEENIVKLQKKYQYITKNNQTKDMGFSLVNPTNNLHVEVNRQLKTVRDQGKNHQLSKDVYLQQMSQQLKLFQNIKAPQSAITTPHYQYQTPQYKHQYDFQPLTSNLLHDQQKNVIPSKFSYLQSSFKQSDTKAQPFFSTFERRADVAREPQSDVLIDRLTNKLNQYINYHQLVRQPQLKQWDTNEPTHRKMQLNFNELKKHSSFHKP